MARKDRKTREDNDMIITSEMQRKWERAARRQKRIKDNSFIRGGAHRTSKSDIEEDQSNTISEAELKEIIEKEYGYYDSDECGTHNSITLGVPNIYLTTEED